jgi:hypothetical protein
MSFSGRTSQLPRNRKSNPTRSMARMHEDDIYSEENRCYLNICYLIPSVVTRGRVCLSDIYR